MERELTIIKKKKEKLGPGDFVSQLELSKKDR
jgi:hypothetical protein